MMSRPKFLLRRECEIYQAVASGVLVLVLPRKPNPRSPVNRSSTLAGSGTTVVDENVASVVPPPCDVIVKIPSVSSKLACVRVPSKEATTKLDTEKNSLIAVAVNWKPPAI